MAPMMQTCLTQIWPIKDFQALFQGETAPLDLFLKISLVKIITWSFVIGYQTLQGHLPRLRDSCRYFFLTLLIIIIFGQILFIR